MKKSSGTPVLIAPIGSAPALERISLGAGLHNEDWLQRLIFDHPEVMPIADIEPGFGRPVPAAREVPCATGYIDNLYVTPTGDIVLVETKLWRNVQARREVVAQALDYVAALMALGYAEFETAILRGDRDRSLHVSLYAMVANDPDALDEAGFVDAIALNLRRGRMLVMVLGDGIRQEVEALVGLLQSHAGAHFTFALVELATWRNPVTGDILAVPNTLAQTVMIERGIVLIENGIARIQPMSAATAVPVRAHTISDTLFYEELARKGAALPQALRNFIARAEPLGVYPDLKASLSLKVILPDASKAINLGYIQKNGQLWTSPLKSGVPRDIALAYNQRLADLIGGTVADGDEIYVTTNGKSAPQVGLLLPQHAESWLEAIRLLIQSCDARERAIAA